MIQLPSIKTKYKWALGFVACAVLLCFIVGAVVSGWKDARFNEREAEYRQQLDTLKTEREKAIGRAELFERQARELEAQRQINEAIISASGARAQIAKEAIENEDKQFTEAIRNADADISPCARIIHICEAARRLGYYPKSKACTCTD